MINVRRRWWLFLVSPAEPQRRNCNTRKEKGNKSKFKKGGTAEEKAEDEKRKIVNLS